MTQMIIQLAVFGLLIYLFSLEIYQLKKQVRKNRIREKADNDTIANLMAEKTVLIKNCEALLTMNKSRQLQRQLARRQNKLEAKSLMANAAKF